MKRFFTILSIIVLMFGALSSGFAETITLDYSFDGSGSKTLTLTNSDAFYVNSWNTDSVKINGTDITNVFSNNEPCDTYTIEYEASVAWAHIEIKSNGYGCGGSGTGDPTASPIPTPSPTPVTPGNGIVSEYGNLQIQYSSTYNSMTLCAENGTPVQLKGIGSMGLQWYPWTKGVTVNKLATDWNIKITRAAMYIEEGGYKSNQEAMKQKVKDIVDDAIANDIYVLIDWHILADGDPRQNYDLAAPFFAEMSSTYGGYPHVLFDICNEPNGGNGNWDNIKAYATGWDGKTGILDIIRDNDPDNEENIIIVGTPNWSQWVDQPELYPINGYNNLMYAFHFYASSRYHDFYDSIEWDGFPSLGLPSGADGISRIAEEVLNRGNIALMVTEWGVCEETGNGNIDESECDLYVAWMESRNLSWVNWSLCTKGESASALKRDSDPSDKIGTWNDPDDLTQSGLYVRQHIMNEFGSTPPPTSEPTSEPTDEPTLEPTAVPTETPDGTAAPTDAPTDTPTNLELQAETDATWDDASVDSDHSGYTGSGFVNTVNSAGRWIQWTVDVSSAGSVECVFRYANGSSERPMDLSVNSSVITSLSFPDTGTWTTWSTQTATISLSTGSNAIRLTATSSGGAPNMDKMDITISGGSSVPTDAPTDAPTPEPTDEPTSEPTVEPTETPDGTAEPTDAPTPEPTAAGPPGPAGYTWCAEEGDSYIFNETVDVAYGANDNFNYLYGVTGTITFNNNTFGDPIYGTVKNGYYKEAASPTP